VETPCNHLDWIRVTALPDGSPKDAAGRPACGDCLRAGQQWVHLRMCLTCGYVGCCDNSPGRHATAHFQSARHPLMRSIEPGENWIWCHVDRFAFVREDLFTDVP
jgi:uncharacterized UBP type Zn finger protein